MVDAGNPNRYFLPAILIGLFLLATGCNFRPSTDVPSSNEPPVDSNPPTSVHLAFGNPSNANETDENNYLVIGEGSAFSYNNSRGTINWVSWKTTKADLGDSIPRPDFRPDPRLPAPFIRIGYYDYSGSGFDRGHMVPSADRVANKALNDETFMMTNIVPQTGALNQYPWEKLESYTRSQAWRGWDVYQVAGVYGTKGILKNKVTVPTNCWKIIVLVRKGSEIDSRTRIIAVDMPNVDGIENDRWEKYRTTIRTIEQRTGYDFFSQMPREWQDKLETQNEIDNRGR